jgi:hypothetical protein
MARASRDGMISQVKVNGEKLNESDPVGLFWYHDFGGVTLQTQAFISRKQKCCFEIGL